MKLDEKSSLLVVDDTPENIDVLHGILSEDYIVKVATSGQMALKIVAMQPPDLILLDVMMPVMDGYEVCRQLKENQATRHIPVIFITARNKVADEAKGFELGAADYISKPVSPPIVRARVRAHLALADQRYYLQELVVERTSELERSNQKLEKTYLAMIQQLGRAADYRDNETGLHVLRVGNYSKLLGRAAGLLESHVELLMYASMMHDIGKIGIPDHILLKPGKLTEDEFDVMKSHSTIGAKIIGEQDAEILQMAREIALTHHEKWNGKGYPNGLSGSDIPLLGRIVAIVDVFDALTCVRPYKTAWPVEKALELISREAGQHFDPELVKLFFSLEADIRRVAIEYGEAVDVIKPAENDKQ
ncbi:MAG: response regulator containing a CheY-like receiver domain and an HD-GYP [Gallionellaceae bacterium]|nr:MAG: response regulator containing a CheY-like receiver domain and an HD-GYP [Gallionellaceae bacterium]